MNYSLEQVQEIPSHTFAFLEIEEVDRVLTIRLNRPEKKNALHPIMVNELAFALRYARYAESVWLVVLEAKGDVFCSGADLKAFAEERQSTNSTIPAPKGEVLIGELFHQLYKPSIAKVQGDVYAGGFLLLAGCNFVVARNDIKLGLPEVKRGLFPFQVLASLCEVMPPRKVLNWCIRGHNLEVERAHEWGLITHPTIEEEVEKVTKRLIEDIKSNSPTAIHMGLKAFDHLRKHPDENKHKYLRGMLMQTLQKKDAREGITAYKEKRVPRWELDL